MKTLYLDCSMGASGDMLTAALLSLLPDRAEALRELNALGIPGVEYTAEERESYGLTGLHVTVLVHGEDEEALTAGEERVHSHGHEQEHHHDHDHEHHHEHEHHYDHDHDHDHEHHHDHDHDHDHEHEHAHGHHAHNDLGSIRAVLAGLAASDKVKADAAAVYGLIAAAEAKVHGKPVEQVHFHEVGALDAVADVAAVCWLMEKLGLEGFTASPVHVGSGTVKAAHGVLAVPAPATAELLKGIPVYGGEIRGELCTPTGAALLRYFGRSFGPLPLMAAEAIGTGLGTRDFGRCNCLRATLGESGAASDGVVELRCNLDDMTGEELSFALDRLFDAGAVDAWFTPITMKKGRPAVMLSALCPPEKEEAVTAALFRHTTTLGVRAADCRRAVLSRRAETRDTPLGPVRYKISEGRGVRREKPEFDDLSRIAGEKGISVGEVREKIKDKR